MKASISGKRKSDGTGETKKKKKKLWLVNNVLNIIKKLITHPPITLYF